MLNVVATSAFIASLSLLSLSFWDNSQATAEFVRSTVQSSSLHANASSSLQDGSYACNLFQNGYQYPDFSCIVLTQANGTRRLEKLSGSQRFRGTVTPNGNGFSFSGEYFCPDGDCTEAVQAEFEQLSSEEYRGELNTSTGNTIVTLRYTPASAKLQDGNYACNLFQNGYQYPDFSCIVLTQANGTRRLEKLTGSQRFGGTVIPNGNGFSFSGEYFCPYGDCTHAVQGEFEQLSSGIYRGSFGETMVTLKYLSP